MLAATPSASAARAASMLAPTEWQERAAMLGDQGKPISRCWAALRRPCSTASTWSGVWASASSPSLAAAAGRMRSRPGCASKCSRSSRYLDCGKRCPGGRARLWASEWKASITPDHSRRRLPRAVMRMSPRPAKLKARCSADGAASRNTPLLCCTAAKIACNAATRPYTSFHVAVQQNECPEISSRHQPGVAPEPGVLHMLTAEQVFAAHKANLETLFGLTNKAFEGVEKLVELNLQVAKTALGEAAETTQAALSVKDAQELLSLQASLLQPSAEKAASYSRHLYEIATSTNAEVAKVAEAQLADAQKTHVLCVD
eukprot:Opistho-1_new@78767